MAARLNSSVWAFEFKQHFCFANVRADTLRHKLGQAVGDARKVDESEGHKRFGCLIVGPRNDVKPTRSFIARMGGSSWST